ncbi:MAG TPA: AAA family ATPase [Hyphomicrobiaceae bacterium]|nr:AAA family ATPase [Hyphomicrobiaceae bacterium]
MSKAAHSLAEESPPVPGDLVPSGSDFTDDPARLQRARPIPRISIQAFCEDGATAEVVQIAAADRRLSKSHVSVHMGGASAAVAHYQDSPTPNLIVIETSLPRAQMLGELDRLANCCDEGTKVVVIGRLNDVLLYRELLKRGVSEYLIAPISPLQLIESLSNLYNNPDTDPVGNVIAFIGAKGGVGSSTVCHNAAWAMSELLKTNVVVADLDLAFGTTGLDFNQDPVQGIAEALQSPERLDEVLLDRLLTKCSERLSIFAAPVVLDRDYEISPDACDLVLDIVRQNVPFVAVDLPHTWSPWVKRVLLQADEIVITAIPDLANLRNAKNLIDLLKQNRANDAAPRLVINMVKMPKRPEISIKEFAVALDMQPSQTIEFDSEAFGLAANNGQMLEEFSAKAKAAQQFRELALELAHRKDEKEDKKKPSALAPLAPILEKFKLTR